MSALNVEKIREDFPQLKTTVNGRPLVYLDNAATTLKPKVVIDQMTKHLSQDVANVHRGIHTLSEMGTRQFEETRIAVQNFINAREVHEVIYTKGTTDAINLLANSFGERFLNAGDEILLSQMEHHSNIVPWQMIAEKKGAKVVVIPVNDKGDIVLEDYKKLLNPKVKMVSVVHTSNTLGTTNPVKEMIKLAHANGSKVAVDGAQSIAHQKIDVQDLDCDFLVFSAHKIYGPNGLGILYGKEELLNEMPPYQGGGAMISEVTFEKTTYNILPNKFEAGTPAIAEVIAFKAAIDYVQKLGMDNIYNYEHELLAYATSELKKIAGIRLIGESETKSGVLSFVLEGVHPHDLGTLLDKQGVAIRTGHHCTQPLMKRFGITACARASFTFYNTKADVDALIAAINKAKEFLL
ncbi:cysteine desulfurase CsdA [Bacteriovorax stolpii]|uniref:Cysteine desulfurase n=1 Tax=Bacteriovorax stolpii TaxID=960 RepID=A0A2K9NR18_BACTC|nr:cysteine desulfurase [Bacteriovorax stolpii]AUN97942.1 cysteine desulfurase CsdA [Bacteriovorax stolpii]TDP51775.1 cysteine desulfurase/selenocysteine lyase [Bacteriovorax stolpii]